jgi:hypothetical protein
MRRFQLNRQTLRVRHPPNTSRRFQPLFSAPRSNRSRILPREGSFLGDWLRCWFRVKGMRRPWPFVRLPEVLGIR